MSRKIMAKITVKGTLNTVTPLSIGGTGVGEHVDIQKDFDEYQCGRRFQVTW